MASRTYPDGLSLERARLRAHLAAAAHAVRRFDRNLWPDPCGHSDYRSADPGTGQGSLQSGPATREPRHRHLGFAAIAGGMGLRDDPARRTSAVTGRRCSSAPCPTERSAARQVAP